MYSLHLTPEQIEIRDTVRDFAAGEIKPLAEKPERMEARDRSPMTGVLAQAAELGLKSLSLSEANGGSGADALTAAIVAEELAFGCPDTAAILAETSMLAGVLFDVAMSPAQRERFLPPFQGDAQSQLALARASADTEIGANYHRAASSARATVTATRAGQTWVLNGESLGVANAPLAGLLAVCATTADGKPAMLLVPKGAPGMSITALAPGRFLGHWGDVTFKDCKVPADHLLGQPGDGTAAKVLARCDAQPRREAVNLGVGRAAYEAAIDYAKLRVQGGRPIIEHQAIAVKLADSAIRLETARAAIWAAAWAADHPEALADRSLSPLPLAVIARIHTAEAVHRAAKDCAECFGAMGVMRDIPLHKHIEDARRCLHAAGGMADAKYALAEAIAGFRRE